METRINCSRNAALLVTKHRLNIVLALRASLIYRVFLRYPAAFDETEGVDAEDDDGADDDEADDDDEDDAGDGSSFLGRSRW